MEELHSCHPGMCRMKALGRNYVWWPTMNKEIEQLVSSYATCARFRNQGRTTSSATIGHIANSIFLVTGGRKEPMAEIFAGNQLETSIAVHTNHHLPSLVP